MASDSGKVLEYFFLLFLCALFIPPWYIGILGCLVFCTVFTNICKDLP